MTPPHRPQQPVNLRGADGQQQLACLRVERAISLFIAAQPFGQRGFQQL
jgi:hypothetical protein